MKSIAEKQEDCRAIMGKIVNIAFPALLGLLFRGFSALLSRCGFSTLPFVAFIP